MGALSGQLSPGNGGVLPPPAGAGGTSGVGVGVGVGCSCGCSFGCGGASGGVVVFGVQLQAALTEGSQNSEQIIAEDSGHYIQLEQPDLVIDAIRQVVDAARNGNSI